MSNENVSNAVNAAVVSIQEAVKESAVPFRDLAAQWASLGMRAGVGALNQGIKTLELAAKNLGSCASAVESTVSKK
jgi:hypothetical protein